MAQTESDELGHNYIGTEHLLLGAIGEESIATRVLETLGVDITKIRPQVLRMLGGTTEVSTTTTEKLEIAILLQSIEEKTVAIDRAVSELKEDIAALRRRIT